MILEGVGPGSAARDGPVSEAAARELTRRMGANLRRLRVRRGLSLERLSGLSSVSRAMLSQIELGRSTPTINVAWKITSALGVPFSALIASEPQTGVAVLRRAGAKVLSSHDGKFTSRALFPFDEPRRTEFYELRLAPGGVEAAAPHAPGTTENLMVHSGALELEVAVQRTALEAGDAIFFHADVPHVYRNVSSGETLMYLVMSYAETVS